MTASVVTSEETFVPVDGSSKNESENGGSEHTEQTQVLFAWSG